VQKRKPLDRAGALSIEQVLAAARARLRRLSPDNAYEAMVKTEATLVDIRPEGQRAIEGSIAGALVVERNVLEWRFDPASSARLPVASDHDIQVIVFCSEGYSSSLAAIALQDSWTPPRDRHDWWISGVEGNGSADCSAKRGFLSRVSHVSRFSSRGFCAQNSCVSSEAMNLIPAQACRRVRLSLAGAHSSLLLA
jgi:rhodanese-related sulfurtransferase